MSAVKPRDVVQIDPVSNPKFAGCFAVVEEVKSWGVVAYVACPGPSVGQAYVRLAHEHFVRVGKAEWVLGEPAPLGPEP